MTLTVDLDVSADWTTPKLLGVYVTQQTANKLLECVSAGNSGKGTNKLRKNHVGVVAISIALTAHEMIVQQSRYFPALY